MLQGSYAIVPVEFTKKFKESVKDYWHMNNMFTKRPDLRQREEYFNEVRTSSPREITKECTWIIFCTVFYNPLTSLKRQFILKMNLYCCSLL